MFPSTSLAATMHMTLVLRASKAAIAAEFCAEAKASVSPPRVFTMNIALTFLDSRQGILMLIGHARRIFGRYARLKFSHVDIIRLR